ncbi:MAG: hypothetical protein AAFR45_11275 [Pseudomonadota bacterium]
MRRAAAFLPPLVALFPVIQPAQADPTIGFGVTFVFGQGVGASFKILSDDERDNPVATVGIDYLFENGV